MPDAAGNARQARLSPATAWVAEGARVGLVTCLECGAALLLDPREKIDVPRLHADWHAATAEAKS